MAELIDREATYEVLTSFYHHNTDAQHMALQEALNKVPSVQPDVPDTNVGDMISRQAAIMAVLYGSLGATTIYGRTEQGMTAQKETVQAIRMLPSADAVEVVRCNGCKHYRDYGCQRAFVYPKPDDFCSYGERADG